MTTLTLTLYRYRLERDPDGRLFAYGYNTATAGVCIVQLIEFDVETRTGTTIDGASFALQGLASFDMNAGWRWLFYCAEHCINPGVDVTHASKIW